MTSTQESLAQMLGAQRTSVSTCIAKLQREGLIRTSRRSIEGLDIGRLERIACDCRESLAMAKEEIWAPLEEPQFSSG